MAYRESSTVIGFSGFDLAEECYQYNENACYIADTPDAAEAFMKNSLVSTEEFRIEAVTIGEIMNDYGASCGEFAMEPAAFRRFGYVILPSARFK